MNHIANHLTRFLSLLLFIAVAGLGSAVAQDKSPFEAGAAPPRAAHFVKPKLVADLEFVEWTRSGQLRAPSFKGLRDDKTAKEVIREGG